MYLNATTYNGSATAPGFISFTTPFTTTYIGTHNITFDMGFNATFILYDEKTEGIFNVSSPSKITFYLFCPNSTYQSLITSNTTAIPVTCDYTKFRFVLDWGTTTSYYRTFILSPDDISYQVKVYLIDLNTATGIENQFILDDLLNKYSIPSLYIYKVIGNATYQITADYADIENKVTAFLIQNNEYIIEIHSTTQPTLVLGKYTASAAGARVISLYDIVIPTSTSGFLVNVQYAIGTQEEDNTSYYVSYLLDGEGITNDATFSIFQDNLGGALLYNYTVHNMTNLGVSIFVNQTQVNPLNSTVVANLCMNYGGTIYCTSKKIQGHEARVLNEFYQFVGTDFANWFIIILISILALYSTQGSAYIMGGIIALLALVLFAMGWFVISGAIIVIVILIATINFFKKGEQQI
jgi:hypothetical protein